jgi:enamine deaminase RidA (YjgF/YER057c/UK114 family)
MGDGRGGIERDDPFGGAYGAALGVRAGDFLFITVAGVERLDDGEPVFASSFDRQLRLVHEHLVRRLERFDRGLDAVVDATVWIHPSVDMSAGALLDALQQHVFRGVVPAVSFIRSPLLYPEALLGFKVVAYAPLAK